MIDDLSDLICEIKVGIQALAQIQIQRRLEKYTKGCESVLGQKFSGWGYLPRSALEDLLKKIKQEMESES